MAIINLKDFYYWYTEDKFIMVSDEVAEEMMAEKRYEKSNKQRTRRNKSFYSFDVQDGIEATAIIHSTDDPAAVLEMKERFCNLCCALNSLPDIQGRRIDAYFLLGMSRKEIATADGVSESSVNESIERGLRAMKKYLIFSENGPVKCHKSEAGI